MQKHLSARAVWLTILCVWLAILTLPLGAATQEVTDPNVGTPMEEDLDTSAPNAKPAPEDKERKWFFQGDAFEEYRFRYSTNVKALEISDSGDVVPYNDTKPEQDHDLRLFLSGYLWESSDHFAADLSMGLWFDLNGVPSTSEPTAFGDVNDYTSPQGWHDSFDVYSLYAEYHSNGVLALARAGRQASEYGRPVIFDGGTLTLSVIKPYLDFAVFGGRTVYFFELNDNLFEDWVVSAVTIVRPLPNLRFELDYRYLTETTISQDEIKDHSYGLTAWYMITHWARVRGYVRGLNTAVSDAGGGVAFEWADLEFGIRANADAQLITLRVINELDDPYFSVLGESLPHLRVDGNIWKHFTTKVGTYGLQLGLRGRLLTEDEPTQFNRNYGNAYLLFDATDIGVSGPFLSAIVEYHFGLSDPEVGDDTLFTVGGSAGYEGKQFKGTLGTYFLRYKYDYYVDVQELTNVRGYFGEFRYDPLKWLSIRLRYELEQFDRDIHTLTLTLTQSF